VNKKRVKMRKLKIRVPTLFAVYVFDRCIFPHTTASSICQIMTYAYCCNGGAEIARPDNAAPD